jgi:hypothetical protein
MHRIFKNKRDLAVSASRLRRQRRQRPGLESLEDRQLLSLTSNPFQVNTTQGIADMNADTASSPSGIRVVVWEDIYRFNINDHDIYAQMYNPDGSRRGGQISVETNSAFQTGPRVAMDSNGDFVVVWQENTRNLPGNTNPNDYIVAKTFDSNGNALTGRIAVTNDFGDGLTDITPDVAMDSFGHFTVVWESLRKASGGSPAQAQIRAVESDLFGDFFQTPFVPEASGDFQESPSVAMTPDGRIDIAYMDGVLVGSDIQSPSIRVTRFDAFADRLADQLLQATAGSGYFPSISMDNNGNAAIAYETIHSLPPPPPGLVNTFDISVDRLRSLGDELGGPNITSTGLATHSAPFRNGIPSRNPDIALDPNGTGMFVVTYETLQVGVPGTRSISINEVDGNNNIFGGVNLGAFPNNTHPTVSMDGHGGYMVPFTANVGSSVNPQQIFAVLGQLPFSPAAKDLKLTPTIQLGHLATLTGSLTDPAGNKNLTLTVNWGDGSKPDQSKPGLMPFAVTHKYLKIGIYKVHVTWSDDHGLSRSRDLFVTVNAPKGL